MDIQNRLGKSHSHRDKEMRQRNLESLSCFVVTEAKREIGSKISSDDMFGGVQ
jgi:hypothetical protein